MHFIVFEHTLYLSFYSTRLYQNVAKSWNGFGIKYFFLLITLCFKIPLSSVIVEFNQFFENKIFYPIQSLPDLVIKNRDKLIYRSPCQYLIKNKSGQVVSLIDTTKR